MKKLPILLVFFALMAQAQVHRFIYDYKYIPDINKKDSIASDLMALDITDKGSLYQSLGRIKNDSVMREQFRNAAPGSGRNIDRRDMRRGFVQYKVEKTYPDFKTSLIERIGRDNYKVTENEKQNWTILPETQQIGEYKTQKATTKWGGRDWTAWFSTDIPFQDGPYKFSGLPGLIVRMEDSTGSHIMTLVENKTIAEAKAETGAAPAPPMSRNSQTLTVTEDQFKKAYANYLADPTRDMRAMLSGGTNGNGPRIVRMMRDGQEIKPEEMMKRMEKDVKESAKRNNNRIEPTLYDQKK